MPDAKGKKGAGGAGAKDASSRADSEAGDGPRGVGRGRGRGGPRRDPSKPSLRDGKSPMSNRGQSQQESAQSPTPDGSVAGP